LELVAIVESARFVALARQLDHGFARQAAHQNTLEIVHDFERFAVQGRLG
jgi:hypothetical protein